MEVRAISGEFMRIAIEWLWLICVTIVTTLAGLLVVAVGVFFPTPDYSKSDGRPIVNLPRWLWLWGNDFDGLDGDKRGWWAENTPFGWPVHGKLARWWWAAVRNPVNNLRLLKAFSCPVADCAISSKGNPVVEDKPGLGGWQFVTASVGKKKWHGFYFVHELTPSRAFVVRAGFKIKPEHQGSDEPPKGYTFKVNPWKEI